MKPAVQNLDAMLLGGEGGRTAHGSVAQRLMASNFNVNALRTNDVLHKEEWLLFDTTVIDIARAQLVGVADLMARNLRFPVPNAMGVTSVQYETASDMTGAQIDMSGIAPTERDRQTFNLVQTPLPIIHKDFRLSLRNLESGRRFGIPLDTSMAAVAARRVADAAEAMLFSGATVTTQAAAAGNGTIYGYTNFPNRVTGSVTATWTTQAGAAILTDLLKMIGDAVNKNHFGPYLLYCPVAVYVHLLDDLKANSALSILERILSIPEILQVKGTTQLLASNIVLVQAATDTIDWIDGLQPTTVMWETQGGLMVNFKVMMIGAPRPKSDGSNNCGIVHYS
jgi:uncharacterized linocin/CFP29 family protein